MKYKIKKLQKKLLTEIVNIEKECFLIDIWTEEIFTDFLDHPFIKKIGLFNENNELIGYIIYDRDYDDSLHLLNLAIKSSYRRQGLGTRLINYAIKNENKKEPLGKVYFEVQIDNYSAISLYEKLGFKKSSIIKEAYEDKCNAVIMEKLIQEKNEK